MAVSATLGSSLALFFPSKRKVGDEKGKVINLSQKREREA